MRQCALCIHEKRQEYEEALLRNEVTQQEIGEKVGVDRSNIARHMRKHLDPKIEQNLQPKIEQHIEEFSDTILQKLQHLHSKLEKIAGKLFDGKQKEGKEWDSNKASFVREYARVIELEHKLLGGDQPIIQIQVNEVREEIQQINTFMIETACEKCRGEYIKWLEEQTTTVSP